MSRVALTPVPRPSAGPIRFAGYAALFDIADGAKDTIKRGAFTASLSARKEALPLYWQHKPDMRIGEVEAIEEDERGLRVIARIDNPQGKAAAMLRARQANGLSFGYRARAFRHEGDGRSLEEIDIFEVSLVTHPLQHGARIHLVA